jgi:hypothetical protein
MIVKFEIVIENRRSSEALIKIVIFYFFSNTLDTVLNCFGGWEDQDFQHVILSSQDATARYCFSYRKDRPTYRSLSHLKAPNMIMSAYDSVPAGNLSSLNVPPKHLHVFLSPKNCQRHSHNLQSFELINQGEFGVNHTNCGVYFQIGRP